MADPILIAGSVLRILDLLDTGNATADELRNRAIELPNGEGKCLLPLINLAESVHQHGKPNKKLVPPVKNPRYRKGTGMRAVTWSDCLWQPKEV